MVASSHFRELIQSYMWYLIVRKQSVHIDYIEFKLTSVALFERGIVVLKLSFLGKMKEMQKVVEVEDKHDDKVKGDGFLQKHTDDDLSPISMNHTGEPSHNPTSTSEMSEPTPTETQRWERRLTPYEKLSLDLTQDQQIMKEITLGRRIGFYRIRGELGSGNFSQVKLGIHVLTKGRSFYVNRSLDVRKSWTFTGLQGHKKILCAWMQFW